MKKQIGCRFDPLSRRLLVSQDIESLPAVHMQLRRTFRESGAIDSSTLPSCDRHKGVREGHCWYCRILTDLTQKVHGVTIVGEEAVNLEREPTVSFVVIGQRPLKSRDMMTRKPG